MKVLFFTPIFSTLLPYVLGSTKSVGMPGVYKLWQGLVDQGHSIVVVGPADTKAVRSLNVRKCRTSIGEFFILPPQSAFMPDFRNNKITERIANLLFIIYCFLRAKCIVANEKPDIMYNAFQFGFIGNIIAALYRIPSIMRAYGTFLGSSVRPGPFKSFKFIMNNLTAVLAFIFQYYSFLIMTNDGTRGDIVANAFGVPDNKFIFWINGIDKIAADRNYDNEVKQLREKLNIKKSTKVVLTLGRLADWKRVDRIIRCAPQVNEKIDDVIFLIVGDGPELNKLKEMAQDYKITSSIRFTGFVTHNQVYRYFELADVYVEVHDVTNLCNTMLEAMLCGKCIVSLDDGSLNNIIEDGKNGILIPPHDLFNRLPSVLVKLLTDRQLCLKLGANAESFASKNFETWETRINNEIDLMKRII